MIFFQFSFVALRFCNHDFLFNINVKSYTLIFLEMFKDCISLNMTYKLVHFDFYFRITLNVKSKQKSEQLFHYVIIYYLNKR